MSCNLWKLSRSFSKRLTVCSSYWIENIPTYFLFKSTIFRYVPPITSTSPNLPETPDEISTELRKQDSLLNQIHAEMNAGFVTKKREEQLWEVQRIITQLKVLVMWDLTYESRTLKGSDVSGNLIWVVHKFDFDLKSHMIWKNIMNCAMKNRTMWFETFDLYRPVGD